MRERLRRSWIGQVVLAAVICASGLQAQEPAAGPEDNAAVRGLRDRAELEAFLDGIMAAQRESLHIQGAVVSVVKDGQLFFSKGYGYADVKKGRKVDPARTLFRIGSVSKLFTWHAVMQLVEQGKLDLNTDLNVYLTAFKIPATFPEPVTMTHLLTHTPGFEDRVLGLFRRKAEEMKPLGELLAEELPARVRRPGHLASYSNHGTALAGYVVEVVSGVPWAEYIEKNILEPLEMRHTTVRQPLPPEIADDMAQGYRYRSGEFQEQPFEFVPAAPAGSMSAAADDMARFMIAHLQNGRVGSVQVLSETSARRMHSRLFGHDPRLNGMLHGFYEMNRNGERIFGHGGDTLWFHTQLALFPDRNMGLFVSYNSDTGSRARSDMVKAFIDHYFPPAERAAPAPAPGFMERARRLAGSYASLRRSYTSLAKLAMLAGAVKITVTPEGYLRSTGMGEQPKRWVEVEPGLFQAIDGAEKALFREEAGKTYLFISELPPMAFEKLEGLETPAFQIALLVPAGLVLVSALVGWPIAAWRKRNRPRASAPSRWPRLAGWIMCALFAVFALELVAGLGDAQQIVFGVPPALRLALALPVAAALLLVAVLIWTVLAWARRYWNFGARVHYTLVALAGVVLTWWLRYYNLLG